MKKIFALCLMSFFIAACSDDTRHSKLKKYISEVKTRPARPIAPLPVFRAAQKFTYPEHARPSPFHPIAQKRLAKGYGPDKNRKKEPLEAFPIDSLRMVGLLKREGKTWAVIMAPDETIHRVTLGNYLGQNYGRIKKITKEAVVVEEMVPAETGWEHRPAKLVLVEQQEIQQ